MITLDARATTLDEYLWQSKLVGFISPPYIETLTPQRLPNITNSEGGQTPYKDYGSSEGQIGMLQSKSKSKETPAELDIESFCSCEEIYWFNCYQSDSRYKQFITPSSFAHPAKASFGLIERIYKHLELFGLLKKEDKIIDFMAGTSRIPLLAALKGYSTISVELEDHFVKMSEDNKKHAERFTGKKLDMQIIKGDARKLSELLKEGGVGVVSPPYQNGFSIAEGGQVNKEYVQRRKEVLVKQGRKNIADRLNIFEYNTDNPNNIGNLKDEPSLVGFTSPTYENINITDYTVFNGGVGESREVDINPGNAIHRRPYNKENENNLGNTQGETYTSAMLNVYSEAFKAGISPLVIITKNPTREHKLRRLDISTVEILQKAGYQILDYHRAILFKIARNETLDGSKEAETYKGRLSFFKRLSLGRGNVAAQWEDILIAVNPSGNFGKVGAVSPPYKNMINNTGEGPQAVSKEDKRYGEDRWQVKYSDNPNNIGNLKDEIQTSSKETAVLKKDNEVEK